MQNIYLQNNHIQDLRALGSLVHLRQLIVANNELRTFLDFAPARSLNVCDFSGNAISELALTDGDGSKSFDRLARNKYLQSVNLAANQLRSLEGIHLLPNLKLLDVSNNQLGTAQVNCLLNNELTFLDLSRNQIASIANIQPLPSLRAIDLSYNNISSLSGLELHHQVNAIRMTDNQVSDVEETRKLAELTQLRELDFSNNPIQDEPEYRPRVLYILPRLVLLDGVEVTPEEVVDAANAHGDDYDTRQGIYQQYLPFAENTTPSNLAASNDVLPNTLLTGRPSAGVGSRGLASVGGNDPSQPSPLSSSLSTDTGPLSLPTRGGPSLSSVHLHHDHVSAAAVTAQAAKNITPQSFFTRVGERGFTGQWEDWLRDIKRSHRLELDFSGIRLGEIGMWQLAQALMENGKVQSIKLRDGYDCKAWTSEISNKYGLSALMEACVQSVSLHQLHFDHSQLDKDAAELLANFIANSPTLSLCSLRHNSLGQNISRELPSAMNVVVHRAPGIQLICDAVLQSRSLTSLDLGFNHIDEKGADFLSALLQDQRCVLQVLKLDGNPLGVKGGVMIAEALRVNTSVHTLSIRGGEIISEAGKDVLMVDPDHVLPASVVHAFAKTLAKYNDSVTDLDISMNDVGDDDEGAVALFQALNRDLRYRSTASVLTKLTAQYCAIGEKGLFALAQSIEGRDDKSEKLNRKAHDHSNTTCDSTLVSLDLSGNTQASDESIAAVLSAMVSHDTLISLDMSGMPVGSHTISALSKLVHYNRTLEKLSIGDYSRPDCSPANTPLGTPAHDHYYQQQQQRYSSITSEGMHKLADSFHPSQDPDKEQSHTTHYSSAMSHAEKRLNHHKNLRKHRNQKLLHSSIPLSSNHLTHLTLTHLSLPWTEHMSASLLDCDQLTHINVSYNNFRDLAGLYGICRLVEMHPILQQLDFSYVTLPDKVPLGASKAARAAVKQSDKYAVPYHCMRVLFTALHKSHSVTEVDVSGVYLGQGGAQALAETLHHNVTIASLKLNHCGLGEPRAEIRYDDEFGELDALEEKTTDSDSQHLDLLDGLVSFADTMGEQLNLARLELRGNNFSTLGLAVLVQHTVGVNTSLAALDLSENEVPYSTDACKVIRGLLASVISLGELRLPTVDVGSHPKPHAFDADTQICMDCGVHAKVFEQQQRRQADNSLGAEIPLIDDEKEYSDFGMEELCMATMGDLHEWADDEFDDDNDPDTTKYCVNCGIRRSAADVLAAALKATRLGNDDSVDPLSSDGGSGTDNDHSDSPSDDPAMICPATLGEDHDIDSASEVCVACGWSAEEYYTQKLEVEEAEREEREKEEADADHPREERKTRMRAASLASVSSAGFSDGSNHSADADNSANNAQFGDDHLRSSDDDVLHGLCPATNGEMHQWIAPSPQLGISANQSKKVICMQCKLVVNSSVSTPERPTSTPEPPSPYCPQSTAPLQTQHNQQNEYIRHIVKGLQENHSLTSLDLGLDHLLSASPDMAASVSGASPIQHGLSASALQHKKAFVACMKHNPHCKLHHLSLFRPYHHPLLLPYVQTRPSTNMSAVLSRPTTNSSSMGNDNNGSAVATAGVDTEELDYTENALAALLAKSRVIHANPSDNPALSITRPLVHLKLP